MISQDFPVITIADYGVGNLASIANMVKRVGARSVIATTPDEIMLATSLILPGVGGFDGGMSHLMERGLIPALRQKALVERIPVLGLCLGMQLLTHGSEEGKLDGLGWIEGRCVKFRNDSSRPPVKIPHMGWNRIIVRRGHSLIEGLEDEARFYFVHAYCLAGLAAGVTLAEATHGETFPAIIADQNIMGCQFHPEKSHRYGMTLMRNFARLSGAIQA